MHEIYVADVLRLARDKIIEPDAWRKGEWCDYRPQTNQARVNGEIPLDADWDAYCSGGAIDAALVELTGYPLDRDEPLHESGGPAWLQDARVVVYRPLAEYLVTLDAPDWSDTLVSVWMDDADTDLPFEDYTPAELAALNPVTFVVTYNDASSPNMSHGLKIVTSHADVMAAFDAAIKDADDRGLTVTVSD